MILLFIISRLNRIDHLSLQILAVVGGILAEVMMPGLLAAIVVNLGSLAVEVDQISNVVITVVIAVYLAISLLLWVMAIARLIGLRLMTRRRIKAYRRRP